MSGWTVPGSLGDWPGDWTVPGYTEERRLGRGVSGRVVAAVNEETGQRVAIKYLSRALVRDPVFLWSFRSEAGLLATLDIPQVVQVFDYVEEPGQGAAIVMELVHGVSLHEMISRSGPVEPEAALVVLKDSLLGLAAAHGLNIVHRDYKPENVLIDAAGNSRLADFGVAVRAGKQMPVAGTPLYMAPEEWNGAPSSPATDIYAATAVLYECLTGTPPFAGRPAQLRQQHETAAVPLDGIGVPALRSLLARGLAKEPADRPATAIAFVADLESAAASGYGPDWEERGRSQLAARAAALLAPLGGAVARSAGLSWLARRRSLTVAAITLAAVVTLGAAAMAALTVSKGNDPAQTTSSSSSATTNMPTFEAQAAVTPPVTASQCASAARFTYSGTVTSTGAGNLSYQWVYSSGQKGPVQTVSFTGAGHRQVTGETVTTTSAGSGWGEIKMISPAGTSNKASYKLVCSGNIGGISPVASVQPASASVTCGTPVPNFTATGSITSLKAETVTYYWALSDGRTTAPATMTFSGPGTLLAEPLTLTPLGDPTSGQAVLVVSSPVTVVSSPAPYTLSCNAPLAASATASPATDTLSSCTATAPAITFTGSVTDKETGTVRYYWKLPSGNGPVETLDFTQPGTQKVTTTYKPASDTATGSGTLVVTSPGSVTSKAATFTVKCTAAALKIASSAPATATTGTAYSGTVTVTGGKSPYTWAATTGLPTGLTATASAGTLTITGTPTATGTFSAKVSVSDASSPRQTATSTITITVGAPVPALTLTGGTLTAGTVGTAYFATITATGGTATKTWSATGLPAGLSIGSTTGTITGTPTTAGTSSVSVTVTDNATPAQKATATFSLTIAAQPSPTPTPTPTTPTPTPKPTTATPTTP